MAADAMASRKDTSTPTRVQIASKGFDHRCENVASSAYGAGQVCRMSIQRINARISIVESQIAGLTPVSIQMR